jgi:hypothetical protein
MNAFACEMQGEKQEHGMRYGDGNRRDLRISRALGLRLVFQPPLMLLSWRRLRKSCTYVCSWSDHAGSDGELRNGRLLETVRLSGWWWHSIPPSDNRPSLSIWCETFWNTASSGCKSSLLKPYGIAMPSIEYNKV